MPTSTSLSTDGQKGFAPIIFILGILLTSGLIIGGSLYFKNNLLTKSLIRESENKAKIDKKEVSKSGNDSILNKQMEQLPVEKENYTELVYKDNDLTIILRQKTLEYLKIQPDVTSYNDIDTMTWSEFFSQSYLAKSSRKTLDYA